MLQVKHQNSVNIDKNCFIAYNHFFETQFVIFKNIYVTIVYIQLSPPFDNKLILPFLLIRIISIKS